MERPPESKLGGTFVEVFAIEGLVRQLLVHKKFAGDAFANAARGLMRDPVNSWRDDAERGSFYFRKSPFRHARHPR